MKERLKGQLLESIQEADASLTTTELSDLIERSRSVTSLYLNELAREGLIAKSDSRPVYWSSIGSSFSSAVSRDVFDQFIGADLGFSQEIESVKDALTYPPIGLPILIHGNSGVGKSYLAHLIAEYAKETDLPSSDHLIVFNCADYANNPELLSSILFGYVKGAFTGATSDKTGILEQANNGILFLDEVHRLSFENQEKLFQFLDKGYFRRLGEEEEIIHSKVRLLFATTEDPEDALLPTFYRRIPLTIYLKDFHQRSRSERVRLTAYLFKQEGEQIHKQILLDAKLLEKLISRKYSGNVGSLSNEIKILCAQAYREQQADDSQLKISLNPSQYNIKWLDMRTLSNYNHSFTEDLREKWLTILKEKDIQQIRQSIHLFHKEWGEELDYSYLYTLYQPTVEMIKKRLSEVLPYEDQSSKYQREFWNKLMLMWHLTTDQDSLCHQLHDQMIHYFPRAISLTHQLLSHDASMSTFIPLAILLSQNIPEDIHYNALMVAHGKSTASSIQSVTHQMMKKYIFDAINVPLDSSPQDIIAEVKQWLVERDTSNGVIMMVDMGSLTQLYEGLKPQIKGELLVINNLTTSYALEVGNEIIKKSPFYTLVENVQSAFKTDIQYFEGFDSHTNVIVSSISGPEISASIANILRQHVQTDIKVIEMEYTELIALLNQNQADQGYFSSTVAIVTTTPLVTPAVVKVINLMDILTDKQDSTLWKPFEPFISETAKESLMNHLLYLFSKEGLTEKLSFLNPDIIITQVEGVLNRFEQRFQYTFDVQIKFILSMHLAVMIERVILGAEAYEIPVDLQKLKINQKLFYPNMKSILFELEQFYRINISDWEIYVIFEIISTSDN